MKRLLLIASILLASNATASTTYTKEQLNSMDASGQYPEQEAPVTKSIEVASFNDCKNNANNIFSQVVGSYPAKKIVSTNELYIVKIWTNDGVIMVSCSEPDGKKVVTQSSYK